MTTRRRVLAPFRALGWRAEHAWFYNLRVGRAPAEVARELRALASSRPAYIGLVEAVGYDLPLLDGYHPPVRDRSTESRANVAAYFRDDLPIRREDWTDLTETWKRTDHPGEHAPRSFVTVLWGRLPVNIAHAAPVTRYHDTEKAQQELVSALSRKMLPHPRPDATMRRRLLSVLRPRHTVWDSNHRPGEPGPGPTRLARIVQGIVMGTKIDNAVVTNTTPAGVSYESTVNGVRLESDHRHALRIRFRVWAWWLTAPRAKR